MRMKIVTLFASAAVLFACEPTEPVMETNALSAGCCGTIGLCVSEALVSEELYRRLPSSECEEEGSVCAPVEWVFGVSGAPTRCRAPGDLEGRCLLSCMPEVAQRAAELAQQTCDADYLCVPCFDPRTGEDTLACQIEADPGPQEPAPARTPCCDGRERCLPEDATPADPQQQNGCAAEAHCAPCEAPPSDLDTQAADPGCAGE